MHLRVLVITIFCLVYLVKQGSAAQIKKIRRIVYDVNHYDVKPCRHQQEVKDDFKEPPACDCNYHDEQLPQIAFYQLGKYLTGEEFLPRYAGDLSALDPRLITDDDSLTVVDPRLLNKVNKNEGKRTLSALDPRLTKSKSEKNPPPPANPPPANPPPVNPPPVNPPPANPPPANPPPANPPPANPPPANPPPVNPPPENPPAENPPPVNPAPVNPPPENSPPPETEPVVTPEQWSEFIGSLRPGSLAWQNRNVNTRGRIM